MTQIEEWIKQAGELADEDKVDEAAEIASRVLMYEPNNHKALFVIGSVMLKVGRNVQAQQFLRRVCELRPYSSQAWGQLSISCAEMHRYEEAIQYAERALGFKKEARTYADASFAHTTANNWAKGRECAEKSLAYGADDNPYYKDAVFHLANCDLAEQRWVEGWRGFKISEGGKWRKKFTYGDTKEWDGEPDAVVMVTGEQGIGDEVMAAGCIPDAVAGCKTFIFDCDARLAHLFARSFPSAIVVPTRHAKTVALPTAPTHHKTLFGLAELFRRANSDFHRKAYLIPNPDYVRMFRALFGHRHTIGIAWSGGFPRTGEFERRAGVAAFAPLIRSEPEHQFVSLQYRDDQAEVMAFERDMKLSVLRLPWASGASDMDVVAALIAACDEVISVATAAIHLSGAMGVPTTILANQGLNWVFAPDELLWYPPTTKIWRKDRSQTWTQCIVDLARERQHLPKRKRAA